MLHLILFALVLCVGILTQVSAFARSCPIRLGLTLRSSAIYFNPLDLPVEHVQSVSGSSLWLADGLGADTLSAIGDAADLGNEIDESMLNAPAAAGSVLQNIVSSPAILAVPILAGGLVAFLIAFFISGYSNGKE